MDVTCPLPETATRVGILGGTFDPVHKGHIAIADSFLRSGLFEWLLVIPAPAPPHKQNDSPTSFQHRFEMLKRAFSGHRQVLVSDIEKQLPTPSYTLQTVEALQTCHPGVRFFLCMGADSLTSFHTWYRYQQILNKVPLVAAVRPGYEPNNAHPDVLNRTIIIDHDELDISSTDYRSLKNQDLLPGPVVDYVNRHHLYGH